MEINDTLDVSADAPTRERVARAILEHDPDTARTRARAHVKIQGDEYADLVSLA